jgi:hypothetical protein
MGDDPDPRRFFATLSPTLDQPWFLAAGADFAIRGATGPALPPSPITGEYLLQLQRAAAQDADVATTMVRVNALMDPPWALLAPGNRQSRPSLGRGARRAIARPSRCACARRYAARGRFGSPRRVAGPVQGREGPSS